MCERKAENLGLEDNPIIGVNAAGHSSQIATLLELVVLLSEEGLVEWEDVLYLHRFDAEVEADL